MKATANADAEFGLQVTRGNYRRVPAGAAAESAYAIIVANQSLAAKPVNHLGNVAAEQWHAKPVSLLEWFRNDEYIEARRIHVLQQCRVWHDELAAASAGEADQQSFCSGIARSGEQGYCGCNPV